MALDRKVSGDLIAVSGLAQTDSVTPATLDKLLLFDESSLVTIDEIHEDDQEEKTGHVEATSIDVLDRSSAATLTMPKATPDGIAWAFAMGFGNHSVAAAGAGYLHTSRLLAYPEEPDYFTLAHRKGGSSGAPADFRRHVGLGLGRILLRGAKAEFLTLQADLVGLGRFDDNVHTETIAEAGDGSSPLVLAYDPKGDDHTVVTVWASSASDAQYDRKVITTGYSTALNELSISDPGLGAGDVNYRVTYAVETDETGFAWTAAAEALAETPEFRAKAKNTQLRVGVRYSEPLGVPTIGTTGQTQACEIESFEYELNRNATPGRCWRVGSSEDPTAQSVELGDAQQTLRLDRGVVDYLLKQNYDANSVFGLYIDIIGPEYEAGQNFQVRLYFPKVGIMSKEPVVTEKKWVDQVELRIMKDTVNDWPTAIVQVQNEIATYLA